MATKNEYKPEAFKKECSWYRGTSNERLFDGYRVFAEDPYARENALIDKLHRDKYQLNDAAALPEDQQIRLIEAMFVHLVLMGAGEARTRAELEKVKGAESIRHYDLVLSHFIRDFSKVWFKGDVPFTERDLQQYLRLLTFINFNAYEGGPCVDIIYKHNLFPYKQFLKQVARFAKKNKQHALAKSLADFKDSLAWHATSRTGPEQKLAQELIQKVDGLLGAA